MNLCECGCGGVVTPGKRFVQRHGIRMNYRTKVESEPAKTMSFLHQVSEDEINYIRGHYDIVPRTKLARKLNMDKRLFNFVCIELGLRREA